MEEVYSEDADGGTPRTAAHMYMRDVRVGSRELHEKTPPIIQSEDEGGAGGGKTRNEKEDPFKDEIIV